MIVNTLVMTMNIQEKPERTQTGATSLIIHQISRSNIVSSLFQETEDPSLVPESTETEYAFDNNSTSEGGFRF